MQTVANLIATLQRYDPDTLVQDTFLRHWEAVNIRPFVHTPKVKTRTIDGQEYVHHPIRKTYELYNPKKHTKPVEYKGGWLILYPGKVLTEYEEENVIDRKRYLNISFTSDDEDDE